MSADENEITELKRSVARIEEALLGNEDYQSEGLISIVKRHDELFVKMNHMGSFMLMMLSVGAAVGTAMTWLIIHLGDLIKFFSR